MNCRQIGISMITAALFGLHSAADVWYVDINSLSGVENGASWQTAFKTIQPAIDAAEADGGGEVWVAEGNYNETRNGVLYYQYDQVVTGSLMVHENVSLYGGFVGNELEHPERSSGASRSIIDGSNALDGQPAICVVFLSANSTIDGFTVTGGDAREWGYSGAALLTEANREVFVSHVNNCIFEGNQAAEGRSAVNLQSILEVRNCIFRSNDAVGASGDADFYDCVFEKNRGAYAGGSTNWQPKFVRCIFRENHAAIGGALKIYSTSLVENCMFIGNVADEKGGALSLSCGIDAQTEGWIGSHNILYCTFVNNQAPEGPTIYLYGQVNAESNLMPDAGDEPVKVERGAYNWFGTLFSGDPHFVDAEHGDYRLMPDSPAIDGNELLYSTVPELFTPDLAGTVRPINEKYDFGAYEYDPQADSDGDGLTNDTEWTTYHTHPYKADTDGDHVPDGIEIQYGTDPLDPSSTPPILPLAAGAVLISFLFIALWRIYETKCWRYAR